MKNILYSLFLLFSVSAYSNSFDWKSVQSIYGSLNPSVTAVNAPAGWIYQSTNGSVYVKQDYGNTTNWSILAGGGGGGVTSLNGLTGALSLIAGTGISVTPSGSGITIATTGGGSGTVTSVIGTAPIISDGSTTTPTISCAVNTDSTAGCVTAADHTTYTGYAASIALRATIASPSLTGTPRSVTPPTLDSSTRIATTSFVDAAIGASTPVATTWGTITGVLSSQTDLQNALNLKAPVLSPALTGTPTAPTAAALTSTTQLATTAFVTSAIGSSTIAIPNLTGPIGSVGISTVINNQTGSGVVFVTQVSPSLLGAPTTPTAPTGSSNTVIADTAFVTAAIGASTAGLTNLTGPIGSVGASTFINNQTGLGTIFATSISPIFTGNVTSGAFVANGAAGNGFLELATQSADPTAIAGNGFLETTSIGNMGWKSPSTVTSSMMSLSASLLTNDRIFTLPDSSMNVAGSSSVIPSGSITFGRANGLIATSPLLSWDNQNNILTTPTINGGSTSGGTLVIQGSSSANTGNSIGPAYSFISSNNNASSVAQKFININPVYNQTGTAAGTDIFLNRSVTSVGSGAQNLMDLQNNGTSEFKVNSAGTTTTGGSVTIGGTGLTFAGSGTVNVGAVSSFNVSLGNGRTMNIGTNSSTSVAGTIVQVQNTYTPTSGSLKAFAINSTYNEASGNAANTDFLINRVETALGSGAQFLEELQVSAVDKFSVSNIGQTLINAATSVTNSIVAFKNGHLTSQQTTAPVATVNANAGTGATCSVSNATDTAGNISLTTTAVAPSAGAQCSIAFNAAYGVAPICTVTDTNSNSILFSVTNGVYFTTTTTTLVVNYSNSDAAGHANTMSYHCIETQ